MQEKERKHNSLAKLSGYSNQTVGTRVDEDLNERLIKNDQARDFNPPPPVHRPIFPSKARTIR
jgi:hypothetical protein